MALCVYICNCDHFLPQGSSTTDIVFEVAADGTPELSEIYSLSLTAVRTVSNDVSQMGIAELNSLATMATLTVQASDNPHGVVEFQEASVQAQSEENSPIALTVVREFGTIGEWHINVPLKLQNISHDSFYRCS